MLDMLNSASNEKEEQKIVLCLNDSYDYSVSDISYYFFCAFFVQSKCY